MARSQGSFDRRKFLGRISAGAAGASVGLAMARGGAAAESATAKLEKRNEQPGMTYARLGRTNLSVSRLSFGCGPLNDETLPILDMLVERGVNLVHISGSYGRGAAVAALGKYLKQSGNRDKIWIILRAGREATDNIDEQLRALNTDHIDVFCAGLAEPEQIRSSEREKEIFEKLKKAGKVRFHNLTTHTSPEASMAAGLDAGCYDNILSVVDLTNVKQFQPVMQRAAKMDVGILAMKTVRSGRPGGGGRRGGGQGRGRGASGPAGPTGESGPPANQTPDKIAPVILNAGVTSILKGITTREEVAAWVAAVGKAETASARIPESREVASGICTLCGKCDGCPNGVAIQDIVRDFTYYHEQLGLPLTAAERYGELRIGETALACADCGRCEERCPMNVPVRRLIREAHARLGTLA